MKHKTKQHWSKSNMLPAFTLSVPDHNEEIVVLEGGDENSLLFGPYRSSDSYYPSNSGTVVIYGNHHLNFLKNINLNDKIILNDNAGSHYYYFVEDVGIIDINNNQIELRDTEELKLVTPWPFDRQDNNKPLRFIVTARKNETLQE